MSLPVQHVHAILDRSGSMNGKTEDVIGGFRSNIKNLREEQNFDIYISAKMFDNEETVLLRSTPVKDLTDEELDDALKLHITTRTNSFTRCVG